MVDRCLPFLFRRARPGRLLRRWWVSLAVGLSAASASAGEPLVVAEAQGPAHFNPLHARDMYVVRALDLVYDGLIGYDRLGMPRAPRLARAWRFTEDRRAVVFELRGDVSWHDGRPFGADDVVFTVDVMRHGQPWFAELVTGAVAEGPHRVRLVLAPTAESDVRILRDLTFKILPRHAFPDGTVEIPITHAISQKPIGTGPFIMAERGEAHVAFSRHAGHRPQPAALEQIRLHAIPEPEIQKQSFKHGLLGLMVRVRPRDVDELRKARQKFQVFESPSLSWWFIGYNFRGDRPVKDRALREALTFALDREALRSAHLGDGCTISGPFSCTDVRNPRAVEPRAHDPERALALLTAAGYTRPRGRLLDPRGRPVSLRLLVQPPLGAARGVFTDMQAQLERIGVRLEVEKATDLPAWQARVRSGEGHDMALGRWTTTPGDHLRPLFHSNSDANWFGYANPEVDALLDAVREAGDLDRREARLGDLHRLLNADLPYTFLWSTRDYSAYLRERYRGLHRIHPHHFFAHVTEWRGR